MNLKSIRVKVDQIRFLLAAELASNSLRLPISVRINVQCTSTCDVPHNIIITLFFDQLEKKIPSSSDNNCHRCSIRIVATC